MGKLDGNFKDRIAVSTNVKGKRNQDIVDTIYHHQERITLHDLERLKKIDERGLKHRLREKSIAEENLTRLENRVGQDFALHQNFVKINNVTELDNKAFVADTASLNSEKLKGRFHLRINHGLKMSKKIEMYANDNVAFLLHKGRNFLYKLEKEEEKMKVEMARQ